MVIAVLCQDRFRGLEAKCGFPLRVAALPGGLAGRELFYWAGQGTAELLCVEIQTAPTFRAGLPQPLFKLAAGTTWDVAPDAKRFLVEQIPGIEDGGRRLEAVVNLVRRTPPSRTGEALKQR